MPTRAKTATCEADLRKVQSPAVAFETFSQKN